MAEPIGGTQILKAMIFCAGLGTRFKPWTDQHPKALAVVNGKSLLQRNIEYLQQNDITEIIVNVHHFPDQIIKAIEENKGWGSTINISDEREKVLETGGGLLFAKKNFTPGEIFITCNADILTDLNINDLLSFHKKQKALISFGITGRVTSRNLLFDKMGRLWGWQNNDTGKERGPICDMNESEKKEKKLVPKAYSCVVAFEYEVFDLIPFSGKFSLIDVYLSLAADHKIMGYDHSGDRLIDVGRPESVSKAESLFL